MGDGKVNRVAVVIDTAKRNKDADAFIKGLKSDGYKLFVASRNRHPSISAQDVYVQPTISNIKTMLERAGAGADGNDKFVLYINGKPASNAILCSVYGKPYHGMIIKKLYALATKFGSRHIFQGPDASRSTTNIRTAFKSMCAPRKQQRKQQRKPMRIPPALLVKALKTEMFRQNQRLYTPSTVRIKKIFAALIRQGNGREATMVLSFARQHTYWRNDDDHTGFRPVLIKAMVDVIVAYAGKRKIHPALLVKALKTEMFRQNQRLYTPSTVRIKKIFAALIRQGNGREATMVLSFARQHTYWRNDDDHTGFRPVLIKAMVDVVVAYAGKM